ncbi:PEP-CTERM sorting domain-containing protein [Myxococcota bacterium]|nr:PEP-CTERM sorting domain-containing protein [Myxococcota bacterium]MCZ7618456.1 PEP-CTERM sorting domain-containing protein [Myxococcota bacterium]
MHPDLHHLICRRLHRSFLTKLPLAAIAAAALLLAPQGASAISALGTVSVLVGFDNGNPGATQTLTAEELGCASAGSNGELSCVGGGLTGTAGGWTVNSWNLFVDPDPTVSNSISVTNNTLATQTFIFSVTLPVSLTFGPPSFIKGSISGSATDNNGAGSGVALGTSGGISLYQALIDGSPVKTLHDDPFSVSATADFDTATIPLANFGIPIAEASGVATTTDIGITLRFTLSPGDSAAITSVFNVEPIPEPTTAIMLLAGLTGLARMGRPRR